MLCIFPSFDLIFFSLVSTLEILDIMLKTLSLHSACVHINAAAVVQVI